MKADHQYVRIWIVMAVRELDFERWPSHPPSSKFPSLECPPAIHSTCFYGNAPSVRAEARLFQLRDESGFSFSALLSSPLHGFHPVKSWLSSKGSLGYPKSLRSMPGRNWSPLTLRQEPLTDYESHPCCSDICKQMVIFFARI